MTSSAPCPAALLRLMVLAVALLQAPGAHSTSSPGADASPSSALAAGAAPGVASSDAQEAAGELLARLENEAGSGVPDDELEFYKRLYDFGVGKRAYSYVSEYKRLPVYNFGLGKRAGGGRQYGFGLGKRSGGRQYGFGLGKRTPGDEEEYFYPEDEEDLSDDMLDDVDGIDKRDRLYSFGLGKRSRPFGFGLGKRSGMYSFGLGKRGQHMYSFGLGKRGDGRMYSFGLGKRPNSDRMSGSRFNFGLGKRSEASASDLLNELGEEKRTPDHRFAFGLGKREVSPNELEAVREENEHQKKEAQEEQPAASTGPAEEHQPNDADGNGKHAVKRSLHYGFGIGKRTSDGYSLDMEPEEDDRDAISEDFTRYIRRPYSFGLGKRVPMYDFGIGKRADR